MSDDLDRVDCLQFPGDPPDTVRLVPAGLGERVVGAHREEGRRRNRLTVVAAALVTLLTGAVALVVIGPTPITAVGTVLVGIVSRYAARRAPAGGSAPAPELVETDVPVAEARAQYEVAAASATPFAAGGRPDAGAAAADESGTLAESPPESGSPVESPPESGAPAETDGDGPS